MRKSRSVLHFSLFFVKLVKKPVFCRYLPRGAFWTSPSHIIFCSPMAILSLCVLKYGNTMYNLICCRGGGRVLQDINFVFAKNIKLIVLYRHEKNYCDIFTRFGDIDFCPLLHTSETTVRRLEKLDWNDWNSKNNIKLSMYIHTRVQQISKKNGFAADYRFLDFP